MSREILFKAKRIDNGEWVEGSYLYTCIDEKTCHIVGVLKQNYYIVLKNRFVVEIDLTTLCQYTGLTDYDGKKIFEKDIIRLHDMTAEDYIVGWRKDMGAYVLCDINKKAKLIDLVGDCVQETHYVEVIGNIFDNPELLGGEE